MFYSFYSVLSTQDGLHPAIGALYKLGQELPTAAAKPAYNLSGYLYLSRSGWLCLSVPAAFVRGIFSAMKQPGIMLPLNDDGRVEPHISVMRPDELALIGGADRVSERGKTYNYSLGRWMEVEPENWPSVAKVWYVRVHSPELQELRRSYGLTSLPKDGDYDFHVTVAVQKRGVLGRNETSKVMAD